MNIQLHSASIEDYIIIQNMARFYVYDRTPYMGWECGEDGMFDCIDFRHYLIDPDKKSFLIKQNQELVGFVLIDQEQLLLDTKVDWNMGEFFILAKFQNKGVGSKIVKQLFELYAGKWSIAVMPENIKALNFWHKTITHQVAKEYIKNYKTAEELVSATNPTPHSMIIFSFDIV